MPTKEAGGKCISLDGDADRIVYYFIDNGKLVVLSSSNVLHCSFIILMIFPSREHSKLFLLHSAYCEMSFCHAPDTDSAKITF